MPMMVGENLKLDMPRLTDVFFHVNNILEEVKEGNKVSFEKVKGPKGATAMLVKPIK